ncbi:MAG: hypothetical protein ACI4MM_06330 [Candidatus Ventricola sp.]
MKKRGMGALLLALLLAFGAAGAMAEATPGEATCEHAWSNGVCTKCNEMCSHEKREYNGKGTQRNTTYKDNGDGKHTRSFDVYHYYVCTVCGDIEEKYIERGYEVEAHVWNSDDKCSCGAVKPCEHDWSDGVCTKCGVTCSHDWSNKDGVCAICSYACPEHDYQETGSSTITSYEQWDDTQHNKKVSTYKTKICSNCGHSTEVLEGWVTSLEDHAWKDGKCTDCGYECLHPDKMLADNPKKSWEEPLPSEVENESTHTEYYILHQVYDCACGKECQVDGWESWTNQPHTWKDGKCTVCDYECQHPMNLLTFNAEKSWDEPLPSVAENERTHTDHYILYDVLDCVCGKEVMQPAHEGSAAGKPHTWEDGKCTDCGYVCTHTTIEKDGEVIRTDGEAEYFNGDVHIQHYTTEQKMKCTNCGSAMQSILGGGKDGSVEHTYVGGVCVCGAKKPQNSNSSSSGGTGITNNNTNTTNNTGTVTTEPEIEEEEEEEDILFEEPAPKPAMIEKLAETVAEAEASGKEVNIEVVGAQQVMTETEYTQLKTLPVQEQILVTLASIGFEDVVSAAVETMNNVELSQEAQSLMETVSTRLNAASAEDRAQMEEKLAEYFPMREIEVDGVTYPYFVMELQIEVDGVMTVQRYGFRMDENGEWIFVMLSEI